MVFLTRRKKSYFKTKETQRLVFHNPTDQGFTPHIPIATHVKSYSVKRGKDRNKNLRSRMGSQDKNISSHFETASSLQEYLHKKAEMENKPEAAVDDCQGSELERQIVLSATKTCIPCAVQGHIVRVQVFKLPQTHIVLS